MANHGIHKLTDKKIRFLKGPARLADGGGLYIKVTDRNTKSWLFQKMVDGNRITKGLGPYPEVSLARAREKANAAREALDRGQTVDQALAPARAIPTFAEFSEVWIAQNKPDNGTKTAPQWRNTLRDYAKPINKMAVDEIELKHILECLKPIWTMKPETARRVQQRISKILGAARVLGLRTGDNPALWQDNLVHILPANRSRLKHHAALPNELAPKLYRELCTTQSLGSVALRLLLLTAVRQSELRGAQWSEIDLDKGVWTIDADRMKAKREHRVPLSDEAIRVLKIAREMAVRQNDFVFPSPSKHGFVTEAALRKALGKTIAADVTMHGFRTTFRTWASENSNYEFDVIEDALAHRVGSGVVQAYRRTDVLEKRRRLMGDWSSYLLG